MLSYHATASAKEVETIMVKPIYQLLIEVRYVFTIFFFWIHLITEQGSSICRWMGIMLFVFWWLFAKLWWNGKCSYTDVPWLGPRGSLQNWLRSKEILFPDYFFKAENDERDDEAFADQVCLDNLNGVELFSEWKSMDFQSSPKNVPNS